MQQLRESNAEYFRRYLNSASGRRRAATATAKTTNEADETGHGRRFSDFDPPGNYILSV